MVDAGFIELKLDRQKTLNLATGAVIKKETRAGERVLSVYCYPRGRWEDGTGKSQSLSLALLLDSKSEDIKPVFEAFVVGKDGAPSPSHAERSTAAATYSCRTGEGWYCLYWSGKQYTFLKRADMESLWAANGGVFTILCGVLVPHGNPIAVPASNIGSHLGVGGILDSTDGSDVSFSVGDETFLAHRAVLSSRSPVFKAELFGAMAEAQMPRITVRDIEPLIFKALLHFVYTDALPAAMDEVLPGSLIDVFQNLLAAADRYELDRLKLLCAQKLWETVSVDTVAAVLLSAERYGCAELKESCMDFFVAEDNFKKAVLTEGFGELVTRCPTIIAELRKRAGICSETTDNTPSGSGKGRRGVE